MKENGKNTKFKSWNGLGFMKNPKLYIPVAIFLGIVVVGIAGLVIWKPGIVRGEYDVQSIVDMLLNHEARLTNIEKKTDDTQTQTNQNTEDVKNIQSGTGITSAPAVTPTKTPVTTVPAPTSIPTTPPVPTTPDPNDNSWSNSHGAFKWGQMATKVYPDRLIEIPVSWSSGNCGASVKFISFPVNTPIQVKSRTSESAGIVFNIKSEGIAAKYYNSSHQELANCDFWTFEYSFSNKTDNVSYPGSLGIWW